MGSIGRGERIGHASFRNASGFEFQNFGEGGSGRLPKSLMLAIDPPCFGATWRSGYAAVCKTVYTSSILVVASSNKIKALP